MIITDGDEEGEAHSAPEHLSSRAGNGAGGGSGRKSPSVWNDVRRGNLAGTEQGLRVLPERFLLEQLNHRWVYLLLFRSPCCSDYYCASCVSRNVGMTVGNEVFVWAGVRTAVQHHSDPDILYDNGKHVQHLTCYLRTMSNSDLPGILTMKDLSIYMHASLG